MGGAFWVGCGWFFFGALVGGDGGGEETMSGHVQQVVFAGRHAFSNSPILCHMLYIEQWGFRCTMLQDHRERCPRASMPWADTRALKFRHVTTSSTH